MRSTAESTTRDATPDTQPAWPPCCTFIASATLAEAEARCHAHRRARSRLRRRVGSPGAHRRAAEGQLASRRDHYQSRRSPTLAEPAEAHNNLAVLLQRRGNLEGALHPYRQAVALGLQHALLHSNLRLPCCEDHRAVCRSGVDEFAIALTLDDASGPTRTATWA